MLRRIASLGQQASETPEPMSPPSGHEPQSPEARGPGRLAGVFRGFGGPKLTKSPSPQRSSAAPVFSDEADATSGASPPGLPPDQMEPFEQLKSGNLNDRVAAAGSLTFTIADYPLGPVLEIWDAGKDLIEPSKPPSARQAGWRLLTQCVQYAYSTDLERREYFQTLSAPTHLDDFHLQLAALVDLTSQGRDLSGFEYDIFPLLTRWLQETYTSAKTARKASRGPGKAKGKAIAVGQDKNLSSLFSFVGDVIKFNSRVADDDAIGILMDKLLQICMNTSVEEDLQAAINVIGTVVTFGAIPNDRLKECVHVLSSIHSLVPKLRKLSWHILANICKSHHGQSTVRVLLDVLRTFPGATTPDNDKDIIRGVRGALSVLNRLLSKPAEKGYPALPLALLVDGLANVSRSGSIKIATDTLKLINAVFEGPDGNVTSVAIDEDWSALFQVAARCADKTTTSAASRSGTDDPAKSKDEYDNVDEAIDHQLQTLISRIERLIRQRQSDLAQRDECIAFLTRVHHALPDPAVTLTLDYFKENRSCLPSEVGYEDNLRLVIGDIFHNRSRRPLTRLQALAVVRDVYDFLDAVGGSADQLSIDGLVHDVLSGIGEESDTLVLQDTVAFAVSVADHAHADLFDTIVDSLREVIAAERSKAAPIQALAMAQPPTAQGRAGGYFANQSLSNVITRGYIQMFMRSMNSHAAKAKKAFNAVVHIARSKACETDARLTAMKMIFRLRADRDRRVYLTPCPEAEQLAASLYRTETSLARKLAEDAAQPSRVQRAEQPTTRSSRAISFSQAQAGERGQPVRSVSGTKPAGAAAVSRPPQRLWSLPDPDALPEQPSSEPSSVLFSHLDPSAKVDGRTEARVALDMSWVLSSLLSTFHHGCDWELYSFILVHMPAQLDNHAIFEGAIADIQELRKVVCELIKTQSFQEPPAHSGLRRPDVANCLFHALAAIVGYHPYFQKSDEDEIVRALMQGIADKTAKTCIHTLSVCCHELPMSVSKSLVTILHKMSQIITQPLVAMHILEFLACLSRLHSLYSNFREEEYRIVFGISFRYLQYVREKKHSTTRNSYPGETSVLASSAGASNGIVDSAAASTSNPADDLPQYVYALAYHVITFWFLALRLSDRPNHIGWIAKNLFTDVDGTASNDEQAQITMDFMQRVAFSDANDSVQDALFKEEYYGEMLRKRWIVGNSIVTIRQARESGWAEVTRRYPSGLSSFTIRENFGPVSSHQVPAASDTPHGTATTLPSFLLTQLVAPIPQISDPAVRPIPLPSDDAVDRAVRLFDRNSAVDGHKVGVIYMARGQTDEAEILANTMGSPDYVEFLKGLGTLTRLKGAAFNTQGLDREYDTDGKYTFCWRDRVTEIVFHVTTQMPTHPEQDPRCVKKKSHIGNDFVNVIFNDSGLPFQFDTFPSEFNYVNIVITPNPQPGYSVAAQAARKAEEEGGRPSFYSVQVMSKQGFPELSPAAEPKTISLRALPNFVRLLALNASVFSHVWANREGGEHVSSWRARYREINRLRDRYGSRSQPNPSPPPSTISIGGIGGGGGGGGGGGIIPGNNSSLVNLAAPPTDPSRPASSVRDSFSSLRRSSVATFFTSASTDPTSHRSSIFSAPATDNTETVPPSGADALVDSVDFSRWT